MQYARQAKVKVTFFWLLKRTLILGAHFLKKPFFVRSFTANLDQLGRRKTLLLLAAILTNSLLFSNRL